MQFEPRPRRRHGNLTPLIDIIFQLLIFFMLVTDFLELRTVSLATPALGVEAPKDEDLLVVGVLDDGGLEIDGTPVLLDELSGRVGAVLAGAPGRPVVVETEDEVSLQRVVGVLDELGATGAKGLALRRAEVEPTGVTP